MNALLQRLSCDVNSITAGDYIPLAIHTFFTGCLAPSTNDSIGWQWYSLASLPCEYIPTWCLFLCCLSGATDTPPLHPHCALHHTIPYPRVGLESVVYHDRTHTHTTYTHTNTHKTHTKHTQHTHTRTHTQD